MNIRKYIAFLRSVELGSISAAADELGYTQSAISKMIADLEEEWSLRLITRSHAGVELRSEGLSVLPLVREVVRGYDDLNFAVAELHGIKSGMLRMGCFTSFSTSILPAILKEFKMLYPDISVQLQIGEYKEIATWLQQGKIDCGILDMAHAGEVDMSFLFRDRLVAVLPEDHPLAGADQFPLHRIEEENFIILREFQDFEMTRFLEKTHVHLGYSYEVNSDFTLLSMVENGLGVSIVHETMLHPPRFNVVALPLDQTEYFDVGMGLRKGSEPSTVTSLFIEHMRKVFR
ncbi:MAG TPA: LysR family transcriptional regulator [Bacillota bacterium]|nr:LysR family transcriptional regulator [Bacillota bacterium]